MKINATYFDNFNYDFDEYKESYKECHELTDEQMNDVNDSKIYSYIADCMDMDWDDFFGNLKYSRYNDMPCVVLGSVGLWYGNMEIKPKAFGYLYDAIRACISGLDYITIKQINGHLEIEGAHHDGSNGFEIHFLNERGIQALNRIEDGYGKANLENRCYHKAMTDYLY